MGIARNLVVATAMLALSGCATSTANGEDEAEPRLPVGNSTTGVPEPTTSLIATQGTVASASATMEFVAQLTAHSSGDYSVPHSLDDALTGVDAAVLGRIGGVERGRVELIDEHDPTIIAAHVNLEVHPDVILFGDLPASEESLYVEFPWPNSTDLPSQAIPIDARVIVLAQHFGTEATELSATAVAAGESEPVPTHLALVSPWGFIVETDAEPAALPMSKADDIVTFARSIGVDVKSFDDMVDLLRQQR